MMGEKLIHPNYELTCLHLDEKIPQKKDLGKSQKNEKKSNTWHV
jgi:hypothetical protein